MVRAKRQVTIKELMKLHNLYLCGMSLSKLAENHGNGLSRQSIHLYFQRAGLSTRPLPKRKPYVTYKSERYTISKDGYYRKTTGDWESLNRQMWKDEIGEIPTDHSVVFRTGSPLEFKDYNVANFKLEHRDEVLFRAGTQFPKGKNYHEEKCNETF